MNKYSNYLHCILYSVLITSILLLYAMMINYKNDYESILKQNNIKQDIYKIDYSKYKYIDTLNIDSLIKIIDSDTILILKRY